MDGPRRFHCRLDLGAVQHHFVVAAGQTVLEAALLQGVPLRASCRTGTCRACRCRRVAGSITYRVPWPGLSADEQAEGWMLPCVAQPTSDLVLAGLDVPV